MCHIIKFDAVLPNPLSKLLKSLSIAATELVSQGRALSAAMDTLRSFKRCGAKGVYRQMSCREIRRQSAVLYRLLTQTIEAPKKRNRTVRVTNT